MVSFARNFMRSYLQPVADLVHGQQPVFPADLFAQPLNVQVHGLAAVAVLAAPDVLVDRLAVERGAGVAREKQQQVIFLVRQADLLRAAPDLHGARVDAQPTDLDHGVGLVVAPQHDVHAREQLHDLEGLDDIIFRAHAQAAHPVVDRAARGQENDRDAQRADIFHELEAVGIRQHHVEQNEVKYVPFQNVRRGQSVVHARAVIARAGQAHLDQVADRLFIVHDQDLDHATASFGSKLHRFGIKTASDARLDYRCGRSTCQMFRAAGQIFPRLGKPAQKNRHFV